MIVRPNGLQVRGVALLGGRPIFQVAARKAANIKSLADLRGKKVGVIAYQDTGYYALLGVLAASGLKKPDLEIQAVGPAGMTQLMISGALDAIMATPEWSDTIEGAGVPLDYFSVDQVFPAMAQAVLPRTRRSRRSPRRCAGSYMPSFMPCVTVSLIQPPPRPTTSPPFRNMRARKPRSSAS